MEWLGQHGTTEYVPSGTVLIHEGRPIECVYVVLDGRLSVFVKAIDNKEIASLLAGEIVGDISSSTLGLLPLRS